LFFIGSKLIGEFTSLEEPIEVPEFAADAFFLPTVPFLPDLKGKLSLETRCES
jgi:hypothetical protein